MVTLAPRFHGSAMSVWPCEAKVFTTHAVLHASLTSFFRIQSSNPVQQSSPQSSPAIRDDHFGTQAVFHSGLVHDDQSSVYYFTLTYIWSIIRVSNPSCPIYTTLRTDHLNLWCTCILSDAPLNCELQLYIYYLARLGIHVSNNLLIRPQWWAKSPNYKRQISLDWAALASHNCMHNTFTVHSIVYSTNPVVIDTWCAA